MLNSLTKFWCKKIWPIINAHYIWFLALTVLVSYGQMLWMQPWQDDNALFFKLAHIDEGVGYFGTGPIGIGITKYTPTPFIPIYYFFGTNPVAYFALLLILYAVSTILIYEVFSFILNETGGRVAGFIFATGYISSDGIWRMANGVTTSVSLITISLFLFSYWKFYTEKKSQYYFLALLSFFLATEFAVNRTHYLFAIVVLFEVIFLAFRRPVASVVISAIRLVPFFYIFENMALTASLNRTPQMKEFLLAFVNGKWDLYYGFLGSVTNLLIPDWLTNYFVRLVQFTNQRLEELLSILTITLLVLPTLLFIALLRNRLKRKFLLPLTVSLSLVWLVFSRAIFNTDFIKPTPEQFFIASLGGVMLLAGAILFIVLKEQKRLFLFLSLWFLVNIVVYSAFNPTVQYGTVERYTIHSFLALVGILGLLFTALPKNNFPGNLGKAIIVLFGIGNLYHAVIYQHNILETRSFPAREFYRELKTFLPNLEKGDILYFDIARNAQEQYNNAVATAMMPETTAFVWRYGELDRYDTKLTTDFQDLANIVLSENVPVENIHTFWYSENGLVDTTKDARAFFKEELHPNLFVLQLPQVSEAELTQHDLGTLWRQPDLEIPLGAPIASFAPLELTLEITALPIKQDLKYPLLFPYTPIPKDYAAFWGDPEMRRLALDYKVDRDEIRTNSQFRVASEWQKNLISNLFDGDLNSVWQSERTGWGREFTFIEIKLPVIQDIEKTVWINGFSQNTPTGYNVQISIDGQNWQEVKRVEGGARVDNRDPQVIAFIPIKARYIRMILTKTFYGDSPVISEFWVVPSKFSKLDLKLAEKFLKEPFWLVPNDAAFARTLNGLGNKSRVQVVWQSNKRDDWQSLQQTEFALNYDSSRHKYKVILPAGGTQISKLKITNMGMPGLVSLHSVEARYLLPEEVLSSN